jgi:outer membrane protein OmpA-like peptidoglycan-associated protein
MSAMRQLWSDPGFLGAIQGTGGAPPVDEASPSAPTPSAESKKDFDQAANAIDELEPLVGQASAGSSSPAGSLAPIGSPAPAGSPAAGGSPPKEGTTPDATSTALFFDKGSPKLTASDKDMLDAYVSAYKRENSSEAIKVEGYASEEGDAKFNKQLSQDRANAVAEYLKKRLPKAKVTAIGNGRTDQFSPDELSPNRRATLSPSLNLTVRDIVGEVVEEPQGNIPVPGKKPEPTLGEPAQPMDISNIPIPEPPPEDQELPYVPTKKPPEEDDPPEVSTVYTPAKGTVQTEVKYTLKLTATDEEGTVKALPDVELTTHVSDPGERGLVTEAQLNIVKARVKENLKLVGEVEIEVSLSEKIETNLTGDALQKTKATLQAELEVQVGKKFSVKVSTDPQAPVTFEWHFGGSDTKKEMRDKMKDPQKRDPKVEKARVRIKKEYEAARDKILDKLPEDVKEKARIAMDEAVNEGEPFDASRLKESGIGSDLLKEMTKVVQDYLAARGRSLVCGLASIRAEICEIFQWRGKNIGDDHFARWIASKDRQASSTTSPSNQNNETTPQTNPCRPRGVPLPISLRMTRLRLNPLTCTSNRFRIFSCPRKCSRLIPPVS